MSADPLAGLGLTEPDRRLLQRVIEAWPRLSGPLKLAVLAIIEACPGQEVPE